MEDPYKLQTYGNDAEWILPQYAKSRNVNEMKQNTQKFHPTSHKIKE